MNGVKKCPKCGGEMKEGYVRGTGGTQMYPVHFTDKISFWTAGNWESPCAVACKNCGYIELYIERKE